MCEASTATEPDMPPDVEGKTIGSRWVRTGNIGDMRSLGVWGGFAFGISPKHQRFMTQTRFASGTLGDRTSSRHRSPKEAILDAGADKGPIAEAIACLEPDVELDQIAARAALLTVRHFSVSESSGKAPSSRRMLLYAPLYLSNYCVNLCTYCGFRNPNAIRRQHLTLDQAVREADVLRGWGFRHILLVAGDFPKLTTEEYFAEIIQALVDRGVDLAVEIAPQTTEAYARLVAAGACGVALYQETYNRDLYGSYHPGGTKASFDWRLEGLDRAAEGGMRRLGFGILLGLADPRKDYLAMMRHARYLQACFPDRRLAFSLPRIHEAPENFKTPYKIDDETFIRMYCGLRIAFPEAELVLSTREPAWLRNRLAKICITQMSAGSRTTPGGYDESASPQGEQQPGQQFPVSDQRLPAEVASWLGEAGFAVRWSTAK